MSDISDLKVAIKSKSPSKRTEPAMVVGTNVTMAASLLALVVAIFPNLIPENAVAPLGMILVIILPMVTSFLIRRKVFSPATVLNIVHAAEEEQRIKSAARTNDPI
jgi:hypothetical protein